MSAGQKNRSKGSVYSSFPALKIRQKLRIRHIFLKSIRDFFAGRGFIEVETPSLCFFPGIDPYIDPMKVEGGFYLSTSPEMHMKRLVTDGIEKIFQITSAFRAGEKGHLHNPEFKILEWYETDRDYGGLMEDTEALVIDAAETIAGEGLKVNSHIWKRPFTRLPVDEAFRRFAGWTPSEDFDADRFFMDLIEKVEKPLGKMGAVFLYDYPEVLGSLARKRSDNERLAERFELYLDGIEICNGFSELTDSLEQAERFKRDNAKRLEMGKEAYPIDERFLEALEKGLPVCAGNALGIDRLLMAVTGAEHIGDVMAFCHSRP